MKKRLFLLISICMLITSIFTGCSNDHSSNSEAQSDQSIEDQKRRLDKTYDNLIEVNEQSLFIASAILKYWDSDGQEIHFRGLFDKSLVSYQQSDYKTLQSNVFRYRDSIKLYLSDVKIVLKDIEVVAELEEYKNTLTEMYIEVNSFSETICDYPSGYSEITYTQFINDYKSTFEKLKTSVDLFK